MKRAFLTCAEASLNDKGAEACLSEYRSDGGDTVGVDWDSALVAHVRVGLPHGRKKRGSQTDCE